MEILFLIGFGFFIGNNFEELKEDYKNSRVEKEVAIYPQNDFKRPTQQKQSSGQCDTQITEIFYSKASGTIQLCKGKILEVGESTRVIKVYK